VLHATDSAQPLPKRSFRNATVAFVAAATLGAPLATLGTADAAGSTRPVIKLDVDVNKGVSLSPNGDGSKDKARIRFTLASRSDVFVSVRRNNKDRTVVYRKKLGRLSGGGHVWQWNGKSLRGKPVRDGRYSAVFVADQVARAGKTSRSSADVFVDTYFNAKWSPKLSADSVYPHTTLIQDSIVVTLNNTGDDPMTALGQVVSTLKDASGHVVATSRYSDYRASDYPEGTPIEFRGTDSKNKYPLPAGTYRLRYTVWDAAGNPGGAKAVTVYVSGKPLVEATGSFVAPPTVGWTAPAATGGGRDPQPVPCGSVVPSEVYSEPGATSFRSSDSCGGTWGRPSLAAAGGRLTLDALTTQVAPRGLRSSWLSMRGKPTVAGESDTARLFSGGLSYFYGTSGPHASSAAVTDETVTTTEPVSYPLDVPYFRGYTRSVNWWIATLGADSYDVADVTVHYIYLTPQS
jgi:FlgD Ig-like domain